MLLKLPASQRETWRSLILLISVVAILPWKPVQTALAPYGVRGVRRDGEKWDNEGRETYLGTSMDFRNSYCVSPHPRIEQLNLPMPTVRHKERTSRVERQTLYSIPVPTQHALRILRTSQIPQLDHMFRRSSRKDIVRGRVPRDLAETSRRDVDSEYLLGRSLRLLNLQHPTHQMR